MHFPVFDVVGKTSDKHFLSMITFNQVNLYSLQMTHIIVDLRYISKSDWLSKLQINLIWNN